jgi:hypothetical protein
VLPVLRDLAAKIPQPAVGSGSHGNLKMNLREYFFKKLRTGAMSRAEPVTLNFPPSWYNTAYGYFGPRR